MPRVDIAFPSFHRSIVESVQHDSVSRGLNWVSFALRRTAPQLQVSVAAERRGIAALAALDVSGFRRQPAANISNKSSSRRVGVSSAGLLTWRTWDRIRVEVSAACGYEWLPIASNSNQRIAWPFAFPHFKFDRAGPVYLVFHKSGNLYFLLENRAHHRLRLALPKRVNQARSSHSRNTISIGEFPHVLPRPGNMDATRPGPPRALRAPADGRTNRAPGGRGPNLIRVLQERTLN